jgi:hypothetical protein
MAWFRVDDSLAMHPKVLAAGARAMGLWTLAGSWSSYYLTDGFIPRHVVGFLGGKQADADKLVQVGLWRAADGGYLFHDWHKYQPTSTEVRSDRAAKHESKVKAGKLGGIASGVARRKHEPSRSEAEAKQNEAEGQAEPQAKVKQNEAPTRPDPTLKEQTATADAVARATTPPRPARRDAEPATFAAFYAAYPLHKARAAAARAYAKALKQVSAEQLLDAAQQYADDPTRDPADTPHPATWLNQGRWADEGPARPTGRTAADQRTANHLALISRFSQPQIPELGA